MAETIEARITIAWVRVGIKLPLDDGMLAIDRPDKCRRLKTGDESEKENETTEFDVKSLPF